MFPESVEIEYVNSVQSVARELMGQKFSPEDSWRIPHFRDYSPLLKRIIEERSKFYSSSEWNTHALSHSIISELMNNVHKEVAYAVDAVPWTVAAAIATEDKSIKSLKDIQLRLMLDLAIGIAVDDCNDRHVRTQRNAAYESSSKRQKEILEASAEWKERSESWRKFQNKLRERVTPTGKKEIK